MPLRKDPADEVDVDRSRLGVLSAPASTSGADADEIAQAEAHAAAARARAMRLRQQADAAANDAGDVPDGQEVDVAGDAGETDSARESGSALSRRWRLRRPSRKALAFAGAVVVVCTSLTASGYLQWHHRHVLQQRQRAAEFAAAARHAVLMMMSIDPDKAREQVQRFADDTTGPFKVGILMGGEDLVKAVEQSKTSSKGTVKAAAVQSMTKDSAVVLVAAKSEVTKPGQAKPESMSSRIIVTVERDKGQLKISRIDFVP